MEAAFLACIFGCCLGLTIAVAAAGVGLVFGLHVVGIEQAAGLALMGGSFLPLALGVYVLMSSGKTVNVGCRAAPPPAPRRNFRPETAAFSPDSPPPSPPKK